MEPFIGQIMLFGGNFAPRGWALCHGQLLPISQWSALFSILGTMYGGDGRTTFGLPDLRGRAPVSFGHAPGMSNYVQGAKLGAESITLNPTELPNYHLPTVNAYVTGPIVININEEDPTTTEADQSILGNTENNIIYNDQPFDTSKSLGGIDYDLHANVTVNSGGGGQSHENRTPIQVINWVIALQGIYPSRG